MSMYEDYYIGVFSEGLCAIENGDNVLYINYNGKVVIDFEEIGYTAKNPKDFNNGIAEVTIRGKDRKYYTIQIDKEGNICLTIKVECSSLHQIVRTRTFWPTL